MRMTGAFLGKPRASATKSGAATVEIETSSLRVPRDLPSSPEMMWKGFLLPVLLYVLTYVSEPSRLLMTPSSSSPPRRADAFHPATSCKSTPNFHVVHDSGRLRRPCCRSASRYLETLRASVTALGRRPLFLLVPLSGQATGSPRRRPPDLRASLRMIISKPARAFGYASNRLGAHRPRNPF